MIEARRSLVQLLKKKGICNQQVLAVMGRIPRHEFIDKSLLPKSYQDIALPIGSGQTISQPYVVARMTELLIENIQDYATATIIEIGSGCGYQTAVLSQLVKKVVSFERIQALHLKAKEHIQKLQITNVQFHYGDGSTVAEDCQFTGGLIAAALKKVPEILLERIVDQGVIVAPQGNSDYQHLAVLKKQNDEIKQEIYEGVVFVPYRLGCN